MKDLRKIIYWMLVMLIAYLIYELIKILLGGSLGFEESVIALLVANITFSFYLKGSASKTELRLTDKVNEIERRIIDKINKLDIKISKIK